MPQEAIDFIHTENIGVFAVKMSDGRPHAATIHIAYNSKDSSFIILTSPDSLKAQPLKNGEVPASVVLGTSEAVFRTLQMDGIAKLEDSEEIRNVYFTKFPKKLGKFANDVFITFKPTWWRFTDGTTPQGRKVWSGGL